MRAALQVAIAHICTAETGNDGAQLTKSAITTLTELTYLYATTSLANDLEAFSQHAGRRTITPEDVQLVARKNPDNLLAKLQDFTDSALSTTTKTATTTIPTKKKSTPNKKKKRSPPKQKKKQSPKSQRHKEMRERLLQSIDTDSDNTEMLEEDDTPSVAVAAPSTSVWDFSDSEDSNAKDNRKPAAQKRKAIVAADPGSSSSEEDLAQRFIRMKERKSKDDWSSDGASDEF